MIHNKSEWGEGPWQHEPDELDWVDRKTGLDCRIVRSRHGSLCGYVAITKDHPAFGTPYDPVEYCSDENIEWWRRHITQRVEYAIRDIKVHGGLTYSDHDRMGRYWFGFDCSHALDYRPGLTPMLSWFDPVPDDEVYRDWAYVKKEVEGLALQLAAIKKEDV